ncbi:MAG TPA: hypothetical protein VLA36_04305 [Longimicrobiales bacterium]|nr:hypothetical protein [Longimicrobiales bacterium]
MHAPPSRNYAEPEPHPPLEWKWITVGTVLGALLIGLFLFGVDSSFEHLMVAGYTLGLSLMVVGVVVGRMSPGETIRETAIVGVILVVAVGIVSNLVFNADLPMIVWVFAPLYAAPMTMLGGWVGEMLQGTMPEALEDEPLDWPWVIVSVVVGLILATFTVMIGSARFGVEPEQSVWMFAGSFLVTGIMVGYFSPGRTMVEPAIAAGLMTVVNAGFIIAWFGDVPMTRIFLVGFGGGIVLALIGGFLGEQIQTMRSRGTAGED